ncbi:MAG: isoaspartyl peptidase/L-asparaginase [Acidobacteriia bacterium]|nr:isoaspartyl peptidase/L-asparaginase [Terriglobia bacterium]
MPLALAIHGGAWNIPDDAVETHAEGIDRAIRQVWPEMGRGMSALDAVELAVRLLEDDPTFNAGRGAHLNRDFRVELDASIMEGTNLDAGAVAVVEGVRHPVSVARLVMERSAHVMLAGAGARRFAREQGAEMCRTRDLLVGRELVRYVRVRRGERDLVNYEFRAKRKSAPSDTVGAVALDRLGRVAAATSTGGTQDKSHGRVGDSPVIGAGTYADDRAGGASSTGWGEGILRVVLAKAAVDRMAAGAVPAAAGRTALASLSRVRGTGGLILVDRRGRAAAVFNTPRMARGIASETGGIRVRVDPAGAGR